MELFLVFVIVIAVAVNISRANQKAKGSQPNRPRPQQPVNNRQTWGGQAQQPQMNRQQMWNLGQAQPRNGQGTLHGNSSQSRTQQVNRQQTTWSSKVTSQNSRQQMQNRQTQKPDIVQRAVANNARFEEDTTREDIEAMHGHSEAEHKVAMEHSRNCRTLGKDNNNSIEAESQSMFGSVEDLIAMGYSGNLEFERDFLGEGLDMINNF